ncbi:hypothetical protein G4V62_17315 [Bacillaceae bacterium SIJ1]|uniref:hypothetical protein n=1 Tax=Litoribacterium kuwaitense TaxID=1398745 RepID=UPI0013EDAC2B|nr:hypothetical protein [Litoribacterium kuwaitense]NGP46617.1 hypothetical protein [Litoribacterium kuwaitense]
MKLTRIENIFNVDEEIGHEITQIYLVAFEDWHLYQKDDSEYSKETLMREFRALF